GPAGGLQPPRTGGGLAVEAVALAPPGPGVGAEGQAEEIAPEGAQDGGRAGRQLFAVPGGDGVGLDPPARQPEGDGGELPGRAQERLDLVAGEPPGIATQDFFHWLEGPELRNSLGQDKPMGFPLIDRLPPLPDTAPDRAAIRDLLRAGAPKLVVPDDDPTGTQTVHGIDVLAE